MKALSNNSTEILKILVVSFLAITPIYSYGAETHLKGTYVRSITGIKPQTQNALCKKKMDPSEVEISCVLYDISEKVGLPIKITFKKTSPASGVFSFKEMDRFFTTELKKKTKDDLEKYEGETVGRNKGVAVVRVLFSEKQDDLSLFSHDPLSNKITGMRLELRPMTKMDFSLDFYKLKNAKDLVNVISK